MFLYRIAPAFARSGQRGLPTGERRGRDRLSKSRLKESAKSQLRHVQKELAWDAALDKKTERDMEAQCLGPVLPLLLRPPPPVRHVCDEPRQKETERLEAQRKLNAEFNANDAARSQREAGCMTPQEVKDAKQDLRERSLKRQKGKHNTGGRHAVPRHGSLLESNK